MSNGSASVKKSPRKRLGRGLASMLSQPVAVNPEPKAGIDDKVTANIDVPRGTPGAAGTVQRVQNTVSNTACSEPPAGTIAYLPVAAIIANPHQPRERFDPAALDQLAASIRQHGLMQPILVRPAQNNRQDAAERMFEIVAGERRWRAAQIIELKQIPAIVQNIDDRSSAELALIENLQREDLNPIEKAQAISRLIDTWGISQDEAAERIGMSRPYVSNILRLLGLSELCRDWVSRGQLSNGHAKALLSLSDHAQQDAAARLALKSGWSVRRLESHVKQQLKDISNGAANNAGDRGASDALYADLERQIAEQLGMRTQLRKGRKKHTGTLTVEFGSLDQFDDLIQKLGVTTTPD